MRPTLVLQGKTGKQGETGKPGSDGPDGSNGYIGPKGNEGSPGPKGSRGKDGTLGRKGIKVKSRPRTLLRVTTLRIEAWLLIETSNLKVRSDRAQLVTWKHNDILSWKIASGSAFPIRQSMAFDLRISEKEVRRLKRECPSSGRKETPSFEEFTTFESSLINNRS